MNEPQLKKTVVWPAARLALSALLAVLAIAFIVGRFKSAPAPKEPLTRQFPVMGTVCELKFWAETPELEAKAADEATAAIREVEAVCSVFSPESELYKLNATAFSAPFVCSPELWEVLGHARRFNALSNGAFDATVKPLMVLWGFYRKRGELPSQAETAEALKKVGMDKIEFDDAKRSVKFKADGMGLDLGGVAKGYALDKAAERVLAIGVKRGLINLGGNMRCLPLPPPGRDAYVIGVRNPLDKKSTIGRIKLLNCSVGTSGDYERYVVIDGKHLTHIMNPRTGLPVENMLSVSIVSPLGVESDGLSKGPFIDGPSAAKEICERIPATSALVIRRSPSDPMKIEMDKFGSIWESIEPPRPPANAGK